MIANKQTATSGGTLRQVGSPAFGNAAKAAKITGCISRQSESSLLASRDEMLASTLLREVHAAEEGLEAGDFIPT